MLVDPARPQPASQRKEPCPKKFRQPASLVLNLQRVQHFYLKA